MKTSAFVLLSLLAVAGAQQQRQPPQGTPLTKETIEEILSVVSPGCQNEVATAMEQQTDISDECKKEVQAVLMSMNLQGQPAASQDDEVATKPREGIHPGVWIGIFVAVLFGSIGAYVAYANKILQDAFPEKPQKKLSKKKAEKMRMKGGK